MGKTLRLLNVEDSEPDVTLLRRHLTAGGYNLIAERVDTADSLKAALKAKEWDLILCDYSMPHLNALTALSILRESGLDVPFIIISGTVGEELAVEAMLTGASDYLPKNNLTRLIPAIERELQDAENRRQQRWAENERRITFEIIQGAVASQDLDEFLKLVHRSIGQIVYAENCFVMLHDPVSNMFHFEFWVDEHDPLPPPRPMDKSFTSYVLRTGQPLLLTEDIKRKMYEQGEAEKIGTPAPSWLGVPLRTPSRTIGVLVLRHYEEEHAYSQRDLEFLSSIGDQIALGIERKRGALALSISEELYRSLVENSSDIIYTVDLNGNYTSVNAAAEEITGYSKSEILTMNMADVAPPADLEKVGKNMALKFAGNGGRSYEIDVIAKDGHRIPVEITSGIVYKAGVPTGFQGIARDITDRRQAEATLSLLGHTIRSIGECVSVTDTENKIIFVNEAFSKTYGYSADELIGKSIGIVRPHRSLSDKDEILQETVQGGWQGEVVNRKKDGTEFPVSLATSVVRNEKGEMVALVGIAVDITERRRAEDALRENEHRLSSIYDTVGDGIFQLAVEQDGRFRFVSINRSFRTVTGLKSAQVIGKTVDEVIPEPGLSMALEKYAEAIRKKKLIRWEETSRYPTGEMTGEVSIAPTFDERGHCTYLVGGVHNLTERKRAEEALQKSEDQYRSVIQTSMDGFWVIDPEGRILDVNAAYCLMTGYKREELMNMRISDVEADESPDETARVIQEVRTRGNHRFEKRHRTKDGQILEIEVSAVYKPEIEDGRFFVFLRDVRERKRAEKALNLFRALVDQSNDTIEVVDPETGRFLDVNARGHLDLGFSREEFLALTVFDLDSRVDNSTFPRIIEELRKSGSMTWEGSRRRKDGSTRDVEVNLKYVRLDQDYVVAVVRDITERKLGEKQVRDSERRFRAIFDQAPIGMALLDAQGHPVISNPLLSKMLGYGNDELSKMTFDEFTFPDDIDKDLKQFNELAEGKIPAYGMEKRYVHKDGTLVWANLLVTMLNDEDGVRQEIIGMAQDITQRKQSENIILQERNFNQAAIDSLPGLFYLFDMQGHFLRWNKNYEDVSGYSAEEISGMTPLDFFEEPDRSIIAERIQQAFSTGEAVVEGSFVSKDRTQTPYFFTGKRFLYEDRPCLIGMGIDITERNLAAGEIKKQLLELQRWYNATLGRETRILDLKHEVNELLGQAGQPLRYPGAESQDNQER